MDPMTVIGVKDFNPWDVISIYDFNFFCCPECDGKSRSKQEFINHASISHPQVSQGLLNLDGRNCQKYLHQTNF